jgi:hypothetical protein
LGAKVPFELYRLKLKAALIKNGLRRANADRKCAAGCKPWDEVLNFKVLVLQALWAGGIKQDLFDGSCKNGGSGSK